MSMDAPFHDGSNDTIDARGYRLFFPFSFGGHVLVWYTFDVLGASGAFDQGVCMSMDAPFHEGSNDTVAFFVPSAFS